jgi:hypothetical protein
LEYEGHHVRLLGRRARAAEHVVAVAPEPFLHLGGVGEALGIRRGRERRDRLAGGGVLALAGGRIAVTARAAPLVAVARVEERLAAARRGGERRIGFARLALIAAEQRERRGQYHRLHRMPPSKVMEAKLGALD